METVKKKKRKNHQGYSKFWESFGNMLRISENFL